MAISLNSTTLSAAVAVGDAFLRLTAVTYAVKDAVLFVDAEAMKVMADPIGSMVSVSRGWGGTKAEPHASGALIWANPSYYYSFDEPVGPATEATEVYLPRIVPLTGSVFSVVGSKWQKLIDKGYPVQGIAQNVYETVTADGAITVAPGIHYLSKAGVLAATLGDPTSATPEGSTITIISLSAYAHTVTHTAGFTGGTTASDVATFTNAVGNQMTVMNVGGVWRPIDLSGVAIA